MFFIFKIKILKILFFYFFESIKFTLLYKDVRTSARTLYSIIRFKAVFSRFKAF